METALLGFDVVAVGDWIRTVDLLCFYVKHARNAFS